MTQYAFFENFQRLGSTRGWSRELWLTADRTPDRLCADARAHFFCRRPRSSDATRAPVCGASIEAVYRGLETGSVASWIVLLGPYGLYLIFKGAAQPGGARARSWPEPPSGLSGPKLGQTPKNRLKLCAARTLTFNSGVNPLLQWSGVLRVNPEIEAHLRSLVSFPVPARRRDAHHRACARSGHRDGQGRQGLEHGFGACPRKSCASPTPRSMRSGAKARTCAKRWSCSA